ncbi:hypothetical protein BC833DRAFT_617068 [Globomyces pollinis-pini]|nr:hypothetical protein BC833DRAFT_617068 [Globomyces pollinis-pini]
MTDSKLFDGIGSTSLWGFSSALDLIDLHGTCQDDVTEPNESRPWNILLANTADLRHVLKTVSGLNRNSNRPIHFYIIESQATNIARHILFLSIIFDTLDDMNLQERTELLLELHGNLLIREKTFNWLINYASKLIRIVTDEQDTISPIVDFSNLKFRERDDIEFVFKFWRELKRQFDAPMLWDFRSRQLLNRRYDNRTNIFDWDYNMKLVERDNLSEIVSKSEYIKWRNTGIAYEVRDSTYSHSNRTMATVDYLKQDGVNVAKWGLFSDILVGPFVSFGINTRFEEMTKKCNDRFQYSSQSIAEMNVKSMIHEILTGTEFTPTPSITPIDHTQDPLTIPKNNFKVFFLSNNPMETFEKKSSRQFKEFFDIIYLSHNLSHRVKNTNTMLKPNGLVVIESIKYLLNLNHQQINDYKTNIKNIATESGLKGKLYADGKEDLTKNYADYFVFGKN